jgi:hypothetical protein
MTPQSVDQAFERLVSSPYYWRKTGRPLAQRRSFAHKLAMGLGISLTLKRELLAEAGFIITQVELWAPPPLTDQLIKRQVSALSKRRLTGSKRRR